VAVLSLDPVATEWLLAGRHWFDPWEEVLRDWCSSWRVITV